jgi:diguanylate cyclase (GGDEF)-like protein
VNDTLGHAAGDSALKHIAEIVTEALRNSDLFFRLGGEEFVCLLPSTQIEGANILAERIRLGIENSVCHFNEHQIELTVSIGVAQYNTGESATNFIDRADKALYSAKNSGRNQVKAA